MRYRRRMNIASPKKNKLQSFVNFWEFYAKNYHEMSEKSLHLNISLNIKYTHTLTLAKCIGLLKEERDVPILTNSESERPI